MEQWHLIVGLGNPGEEYTRTRHNAGFLVVERLAERWKTEWSAARKFQASVAKGNNAGNRVLLCKPQTYMNSSGEAVAAVSDFYQVPRTRLMVVLDDADLPLGEIRLRPQGGTGGHHGLESIESHLGSKEYARLRIGIGRREGAREITGHVLGKFGPGDRETLDKVLTAACEQVECWLSAGIQKAMTQFNGVVTDSKNEGNK